MDNLQSMTYQTFEQDPVKYKNYEEVRLRHGNADPIAVTIDRQYSKHCLNGQRQIGCEFPKVRPCLPY